MRHRWVPLLTGLLLVGCTNIVPEPESTFRELPEQTYPFTNVWECTIEAVQAAEFEVETLEHDKEEKGEFVTRFKVTKRDERYKIETAKRIRVRIRKQGDDRYSVHVAVSVFEREIPKGEWSWKEVDPETVELIEHNLEASLARRYSNKGSR